MNPHLQDKLQEPGLGIEKRELSGTKKKSEQYHILPGISVNRILIRKFLEVLHLSLAYRYI